MKQELLPCPLCKCANIEYPAIKYEFWEIKCPDCRVAIQGENRIALIKRWNTRADHIPAVTKKIDHITTDNSKVNVNLLEENERLKNEVADLKEALGLSESFKSTETLTTDIDYGMRAHELQLALISQGITEMYEIDRKVESLIDYQCSKSGDDRFN